jgi:hypothetical protein
MTMAIKGLNFLISHVRREVFTFKWETNEQVYLDKVSCMRARACVSSMCSCRCTQRELGDVYPYLLVNIGSGGAAVVHCVVVVVVVVVVVSVGGMCDRQHASINFAMHWRECVRARQRHVTWRRYVLLTALVEDAHLFRHVLGIVQVVDWHNQMG